MKTNQTLEVIASRSSIRKYKATPLSEETIDVLKAAAGAAPTAMNAQRLRFSFVRDQALLEQISEETALAQASEAERAALRERMRARGAKNVFYEAPLVVFITSKPYGRGPLDAGIAVENLALAACSLGLGSCIIACCDRAFEGSAASELKARLHMEPEEVFLVAIAIGEKDTEKEPHTVQDNPFRMIGG